MNQKSNQPLKTMDLLTMLALVGVVVSISGLIVSREMKDVDHSLAMSEAQSLAFQLINGGFVAPKLGPGQKRGLASASSEKSGRGKGLFKSYGMIGKDPWGRSFKYRVLRNDSNDATHVVVWSMGPNAKEETKESDIVAYFQNNNGRVQFSGDDFGFVQAINNLSQIDTSP